MASRKIRSPRTSPLHRPGELCGGLKPHWTPGTPVLISDHLNLTGRSPEPPPEELTADSIIWSFNRLPVGGVGLVHELVPLQTGRLPVARWTRLTYATLGQRGQVETGSVYLPVPAVDVRGSPTPAPSVPTLAPLPTSTRMPTLVAGTSTAVPGDVAYLPALSRP